MPGVAFRPLAVPVAAVGVTLAWNGERESKLTREVIHLARSGVTESWWPGNAPPPPDGNQT